LVEAIILLLWISLTAENYVAPGTASDKKVHAKK